MVTLENIHKAMNDPQVQKAADHLYREWMWKELDGIENETAMMRQYTTAMFLLCIGIAPSREQVLAAECLFRIKLETLED